jgi:hypothetical protein
MDSILEDKTLVKGQIYIISNLSTNISYVGQTVTHRKNHNKYRPFGYIGRFKDHISEAICNTKKKQCCYLNNAIRKYGAESFKVELIVNCELAELDSLEEKYIEEHNTLYPNGYNLTKGGKVFKIPSDITNESELKTPVKRGGCKSRSQETKELISKRLKEANNNTEVREKFMKKAQAQHNDYKLDKFIEKLNEQIDIDNLDKYIFERSNKDVKYIRVKIGNAMTSFVGKYESMEELYKRARLFLDIVVQATLPNCSGNP